MTEEQVLHFISYMEDTGRSYENKDGFCFYIKISAEQLAKIRQNPEILIDIEVMKDLLIQDGYNIHIIGAYGKGKSIIRKAIKEIAKIENAESVSWFNKDMTKFINRRFICHQS